MNETVQCLHDDDELCHVVSDGETQSETVFYEIFKKHINLTAYRLKAMDLIAEGQEDCVACKNALK